MNDRVAVKNFVDRFLSDDRFRAELRLDPVAATIDRGLSADPYQLRVLWDRPYRERLQALSPDSSELPELTRILLDQKAATATYQERIRVESSPEDARFRDWRNRQINRCRLSLTGPNAAYIPHVPYAIELSKGCSIGCWFCGVDAPRLDGHFRHTSDNRDLLVGVLERLRDLLGPTSGSWGFLYWATDPLDNPDYELFCEDFRTIFGRFPVMTTAQAHRQLDRVRNYLTAARSAGRPRTRFSILSVPILERLVAFLDDEELLQTDIVPMTTGSLLRPALTGRALRDPRSHPLAERDEVGDRAQTIACVSGFLVNMVEKSVKLITPCAGSDEWSLGYKVLAIESFSSAGDFDQSVRRCIDEQMGRATTAARIRTLRGITVATSQEGFVLNSPSGKVQVRCSDVMMEIVKRLETGDLEVAQLVAGIDDIFGIGVDVIADVIDDLEDLGFLERADSVVVA